MAEHGNLSHENVATSPQPRKRRAAATEDDGSSPRGGWVREQWEQVTATRARCKHCPGDRRKELSTLNVTRLKSHLLRCPAFLNSPAALEAAKLSSELQSALAAQQAAQQAPTTQQEQQHAPQALQAVERLPSPPSSSDQQVLFNEEFTRLLLDNNLTYDFVENTTTHAFFRRWLPHLQLPSRYEVCLHAMAGQCST
ncbi:hypothetical protein QJQ45_007280 [Haematococcus lacustris]|nr:hypothetical protein QJQ45_005344 [Haematococcus lacustris]KAJ9523580.1 hypothetical protein QJQ45_007280 [Haematococcus lacustris]